MDGFKAMENSGSAALAKSGLIAICLGVVLVSAGHAYENAALPDGGVHSSHAEEIDDLFYIPDVEEASLVNNDTVGIVFSPDDLFESAVRNLEAEISAHQGPRLVPVLGKNNVQNVYDLLYLKGVDVALVRTDAIEYVKRRGNFPAVGNAIKSLASVDGDKIVILANKDIKTVDDLDGKSVAMSYYTSGEYITGTVVMDVLGLQVEPVFAKTVAGLAKLRSGEVSALLFLLHTDENAGNPGHYLPAGLRAMYRFDDKENFHVLELPESEALSAIYSADTLTSADMPGVIEEGESINAYRVDTILAAYRWRDTNPRYVKIKNFVNALVDTTEHLRTGPQRKFWRELDVERAVPGVERLAVVDVVLVEREEARLAELEAARIRLAARREAERALRLQKLAQQRDAINALIDQRLNNDDLDELESLLEQVNNVVGGLSVSAAGGVSNSADTIADEVSDSANTIADEVSDGADTVADEVPGGADISAGELTVGADAGAGDVSSAADASVDQVLSSADGSVVDVLSGVVTGPQ